MSKLCITKTRAATSLPEQLFAVGCPGLKQASWQPRSAALRSFTFIFVLKHFETSHLPKMLASRLSLLLPRASWLRGCSTTTVGRQQHRQVPTESAVHDPLQAQALKEQCILVDANDQAIGAASKADCHRVHPETKDVKLHRAFSVFLFNSQGEMLVQKRSSHKVKSQGNPLFTWSKISCIRR